jgi:polyhydroxyalkanoate synthesis regulator phasin
MMACHDNGPDPEFQFMQEVMEAVAAASKGIDEKEDARIKGFIQDLTARFRADIEKMS